MDLPRDDQKLHEYFKKGALPTTTEFTGEYWVNILTGPVPDFRWAGHKKRFFTWQDKPAGRNLVLFNIPFGFFTVEEGVCDDFEDLPVVILNYNYKRNLFTRSMVDRVRRVAEGFYLGRYCTRARGSGELIFRGYFSMEHRQPRAK